MTIHVKVVAGLFIVLGVLGTLAALVFSALFSGLATLVGASQEQGAPIIVALLGLTGTALTIVLLVVSIPSIVCGWGLLKTRRWARILGIILAAISVIRFPVGTVFGAYALWVLFQRETERMFDAAAAVKM